MSFYKLPGPWNPGYAIPKYVEAEPPERGTITTQWLPRGTIPQLIPDYLAVKQPTDVKFVKATSSLAKHSLAGSCFDEGTLQGHSLAGDSLGATTYDLEPLGAASFVTYGQKVAKNLMDRMRRIPASHRPAVMKKTLAAIDKTLPARAEKHALALRQRGVPAPAALQHGIARAVGEGAITEISKLGRSSRRMAPSRALRGRGRPQALGALLSTVKSTTDLQPVTSSQTAALTCANPASGQCSADGQFVWIPASSSAPGYWQRLKAGETCQAFCPDGSLAPVVTVHTGTQQVVAPPDTGAVPGSFRAVQVGPFQFPADQAWSRVTYWGKVLPLDWQAFIRRVVSVSSSNYTAGSKLGPTAPAVFGLSTSTKINPDYFGVGNTSSNPSWAPVARAQHPDTGDDYGVWLSVSYRYPDRAISDPTNVPIINVIWGKVSQSTWSAIWNWIEKLGSKIVDVVGDALDAVKDATCGLLQQPGIDQAAVSAAAATPSVPTAGLAAGVVIGQQLCGGAKQPQGPTGPGGAPSGAAGWLMPVAIGGGLLLVFALTR